MKFFITLAVAFACLAMVSANPLEEVCELYLPRHVAADSQISVEMQGEA